MARRRTFRRRRMNRAPSAFAPGRGAGGRTIAWESIFLQPNPARCDVVFPNATAAADLNFVTVMPQNVTRGSVTLERVRGSMRIWWQENALLDLADLYVGLSLQLVNIKGGLIAIRAPLSVTDTADLESNRIIWQRAYYPANQVVLTLAAEELHPGALATDVEIDIKSRRRFDRATWALILTINTTNLVEKFCAGNLRALFRSADGL